MLASEWESRLASSLFSPPRSPFPRLGTYYKNSLPTRRVAAPRGVRLTVSDLVILKRPMRPSKRGDRYAPREKEQIASVLEFACVPTVGIGKTEMFRVENEVYGP